MAWITPVIAYNEIRKRWPAVFQQEETDKTWMAPHIDDAEVHIRARLTKVYTDDAALAASATSRYLVILYAAAAMYESRFQTEPEHKGETFADRLRKRADALLDSIMEGTTIVTGATKKSGIKSNLLTGRPTFTYGREEEWIEPSSTHDTTGGPPDRRG